MRNLIRNIVLLSLVVASPAFARIRAVAAPSAPILYSSIVVDAVSGQPVIGAEVSNGTLTTTTSTSGAFTIALLAGRLTTLTVSRSGYVTAQVTVIAQPGTPGTPIRLQSTPGVTVQLTNGQTKVLDYETVNFIFSQPFTQLQGPNPRLCTNGNELDVDKSQISRILGPAIRSAGGACCNLPVLWFDIELKSGEHDHASFVLDCYTYDPYLGGREHDSYQQVYLKYEDIKEVDFP